VGGPAKDQVRWERDMVSMTFMKHSLGCQEGRLGVWGGSHWTAMETWVRRLSEWRCDPAEDRATAGWKEKSVNAWLGARDWVIRGPSTEPPTELSMELSTGVPTKPSMEPSVELQLGVVRTKVLVSSE
jgi:hypothetical protein